MRRLALGLLLVGCVDLDRLHGTGDAGVADDAAVTATGPDATTRDAPPASSNPDAGSADAPFVPVPDAPSAMPDVATSSPDSPGLPGDSGATGGAPDQMMPDLTGFTPANVGAYKLGPTITSDSPGSATDGRTCNVFSAVVRDFRGVTEPMGHPDFESFAGDCPTLGLVAPMLGADHKPVYASKCEAGAVPMGTGGRGGGGGGGCAQLTSACPYGQMTTSKMYFDQWYRLTDGVNKSFLLSLSFVTTNGVATFASDHFFPLDNAGWGNSGKDAQGALRNFGFTTELHAQFKYNGGETFTFTGDDDVWVFINDKLAIDLGGLHPQATSTVNLDVRAAALGISKGMIYSLDLFHAERHTDASNFRIDTNLAFVNCGTIIK